MRYLILLLLVGCAPSASELIEIKEECEVRCRMLGAYSYSNSVVGHRNNLPVCDCHFRISKEEAKEPMR